jgi:hypothetical protein
MRFVLILICLVGPVALQAQDGSNISYLKPEEVNKTHIGSLVHLDFGSRSFSFSYPDTPRQLSTVKIKIDGRQVEFREHRVDDEFNSWFKQQYLEASAKIQGRTLRWIHSELVGISDGSFHVRAYFDYFDSEGEVTKEMSFTRNLTFKKVELSEVLIKAS